MSKKTFDTSRKDAQATAIDPVRIDQFDVEAYQDYEQELSLRCRKFLESDSGVLVYRRMRVAEVFSYGCRDMKQSLQWQLGALKQSMEYAADVPNFLEPWYGIGFVAGCFGIGYIWHPDQAPATRPAFDTVQKALDYPFVPVNETPEGRHSLNMVEYFLEKTAGKLPLSMGDVQSPFNNATNVVDTSNFLTSILLEPETVRNFLDRIAGLQIDFYREQEKMIGEALVRPGHGFASSRFFRGLGMSDDNTVMVDADHYRQVISPSLVRLGKAFDGLVYHSCGDYTDKLAMLKQLEGFIMIDAAFTGQTDPDPNPAEPFVDTFCNTGVILNARMVGDRKLIEKTVRSLWKPGMKLIIVTYCESPEEQEAVYDMVHEICQ